jgi:hypothetical protein
MTLSFYGSVILSNCLLLTAFVYGVSSKTFLINAQTKWYLFYLGFVLCIEFMVKVLIMGFKIKNTSLTYPFYVSGEFCTLSQMLIFAVGLSKKWQFAAVLVSIAIFSEAMILWSNHQYFNPGYGKIVSHLVIVGTIGYLLIQNLKELEIHKPFLMIYASLFLYYSVSLFLFLIMNQLTKTNIVIWTMNNVLASILYGTSIYTFYRLKKLY